MAHPSSRVPRPHGWCMRTALEDQGLQCCCNLAVRQARSAHGVRLVSDAAGLSAGTPSIQRPPSAAITLLQLSRRRSMGPQQKLNMKAAHQSVRIHDSIDVSNRGPFVLFGGVNVLESLELALRTAEQFVLAAQARLFRRAVFKSRG